MAERPEADAATDGVVFDRYDPNDEVRRESLFALGNGVLYVRACAPEAAFAAAADGLHDPGLHYPGLYVAGGYARSRRTIDGRPAEISALVNLPDPFGLSFRVDGAAHWFALDGRELLHYEHRLDADAGMARRSLAVRDPDGRTTRLDETRRVDAVDAGRVVVHWRVEPVDWSGPVTVRSHVRTQASNAKLERTRAYEGRHLDVRPAAVADALAVDAVTHDGARRFRVEARLGCTREGRRDGARQVGCEADALAQDVRLVAVAGEPFEVELAVDVRVERPAALPAPSASASASASRPPDRVAPSPAAHADFLRQRMDEVGIRCPASPAIERGCRYAAFHLLQTVSPLSAACDAGLPSRGWQESYFGHVFWDELFVLPFFRLRRPDLARDVLQYRVRRLASARDAARRAGHRGAMYPWRSTDRGSEETPPMQWIPPARRWQPDRTNLQRHIGSAIAHNVWSHHLATGDRALFVMHTGPVLVEIARFWASTVTPGRGGRLALRGVVGPDEYHTAWPGAAVPGVDDNAYTNLTAARTLQCAAALPRQLDPADWQSLSQRAGVAPGEIDAWERASRRIGLCWLPGDVLCQFEGFDRLLDADRARRSVDAPGQRIDWQLAARGDDVNRYQVAKQADVLMLLYLFGPERLQGMVERLGYRPAAGWIERTAQHYLARVSDESSLSHVACAGALAALDAEASWRYFQRALHIDLGGAPNSSTHEGLHLGAMGGVWDVLQRHYLGIDIDDSGRLELRPHPPPALDDVELRIVVRSHRLVVRLHGTRLTVRDEGGATTPLTVVTTHGEDALEAGRSMVIAAR